MKEFYFETYKKLIYEINQMSVKYSYPNNPFLTFEAKIESDFDKILMESENSLNTGDLIARLISFYNIFLERNSFLTPVYNRIINKILLLIKKKITVLETEFLNNKFVPIEKALFIFFLEEKEIAWKKFKNIIETDLDRRGYKLFECEYFTRVDLFFQRLNVDFIPQVINKHFGIELTAESESIKKEEIRKFLDKRDYFNINRPLSNFSGEFINKEEDILHFNEVRKLFQLIFKEAIIEKYGKPYFDKQIVSFADIFLSNITEKYPVYDKNELIKTREIIKEMVLDGDSSFKENLFSLIYTLKESRYLLKWNTKFPLIMESYLGIKGFSKDSIKRYFKNDNTNPIMGTYDYMLFFIKENSKLKMA